MHIINGKLFADRNRKKPSTWTMHTWNTSEFDRKILYKMKSVKMKVESIECKLNWQPYTPNRQKISLRDRHKYFSVAIRHILLCKISDILLKLDFGFVFFFHFIFVQLDFLSYSLMTPPIKIIQTRVWLSVLISAFQFVEFTITWLIGSYKVRSKFFFELMIS